MASNVSQVKANKLVARDWDAQAAIADVLKNVDLICDASARAGAAAPLIDICRDLYGSATANGDGDRDMVAVSSLLHRRATGMRA